MRAVGDAVKTRIFRDLDCNHKNEFKSESLKVLELGAIHVFELIDLYP